MALPFLGAIVAMYVSVRAAADVFDRRPELALAAGAALPALAGGGAGAAIGETSAALAFVMAVAVGCATLVLGLTLTTPPDRDAPPSPERPPHAAASLLPAALVVLVAGFAGAVTPISAILMLAAGAALLFLVRPTPATTASSTPIWAKCVQLALAAVLAVAALAWARSGSAALSATLGWDLSVAAPTLLMGPLVALPLVGVATRLAAEGQGDAAAGGTALAAGACVTLVLPIVAGVGIVLVAVAAGLDPLAWKVQFPLRAWRLDAVLLAVVGLLLLPAAAGRWRLGKAEGVGLILLYAAHLATTAATSR